MTTYLLDFDTLKLNDEYSEYLTSDQWEEEVCENEGSISEEGMIVFKDSNGLECYANFKLCVSGTIDHDPGDYWTPPYTDVEIDDVEIDVSEFYLDDVLVDLTTEMRKALTDKIYKLIN